MTEFNVVESLWDFTTFFFVEKKTAEIRNRMFRLVEHPLHQVLFNKKLGGVPLKGLRQVEGLISMQKVAGIYFVTGVLRLSNLSNGSMGVAGSGVAMRHPCTPEP